MEGASRRELSESIGSRCSKGNGQGHSIRSWGSEGVRATIESQAETHERFSREDVHKALREPATI